MPFVSEEQLQNRLETLAEEIASDLSSVDPDRGKELLSDFVSQLFLAVADRKRREERRRKQAEGIAAAKARGIRFGRAAKPVPESFDAAYRSWRAGEISLTEAAEACGIPRGTFYDIAARREQAV